MFRGFRMKENMLNSCYDLLAKMVICLATVYAYGVALWKFDGFGYCFRILSGYRQYLASGS